MKWNEPKILKQSRSEHNSSRLNDTYYESKPTTRLVEPIKDVVVDDPNKDTNYENAQMKSGTKIPAQGRDKHSTKGGSGKQTTKLFKSRVTIGE